ncbi:MAG TPA: hypothetical protein VLG12_04150 [Candidatus Saccharimonadales bacterium]|nr:hypothetical protein [Candidatus Saccharimonadales bacterium]
MNTSTVISIIVTSVVSTLSSATILGLFITHWLSKKAEKESREYKSKEEKYTKLLDLARVFYQSNEWKDNKKEREKKMNLLKNFL